MRIRPSKWDCFLIVGRLSSSLGKTSACEFLFLIICDTDNSDFFFNLLLENCVTNQEWQYPRRKMHGFCAWSSLNKGWCCGQAFTLPPPPEVWLQPRLRVQRGEAISRSNVCRHGGNWHGSWLVSPHNLTNSFSIFFQPKTHMYKIDSPTKSSKKINLLIF